MTGPPGGDADPRVRLFEAVVRLYPPPFRRTFGEDIGVAFRRELARRRAKGRRLGTGAWVARTLLAALVGALWEWAVEWRGRLVAVRGPSSPDAGSGPLSTRGSEEVGKMGTTVDRVRQDVGMLGRQLRRHPTFGLVVVLTLALGIGAATTVYSVVRGVLLSPLPYPEGDRLVEIVGGGASSLPNFRDLEAGLEAMEVMGAFVVPAPWTLTGAGEPTQLEGSEVTGRFFEMLGIPPAVGRLLDAGDDQAARVVLSHGLWTGRFRADPGVVGRTVVLDGEGFEVVGVAAPGVAAPFDQDFWIPLLGAPDRGIRASRRARTIYLYGRLASGWTLEDARREVRSEFTRLQETYPDANADWSVGLRSLRDTVTGDERVPLTLLLAAGLLFLVITCANVASVMIARLEVRRREFAVRSALGAGRRRLVAQAWTETLAVSLLGGVLGVVLAFLGVDAALAVFGEALSRPETVSVDGGVLLFGLGSSLLTAVLVGTLWLAAWRVERPGEALRRTTGGVLGSGGRMRRGLVVVQMALALVLVTGLGLLVKSFLRIQEVDLGVRVEETVVASLGALPRGRYADDEARRRFAGRLVEGLEAVPGVEGAAVTSRLPLAGCCSNGPVARVDDPRREEGRAEGRTVTPGFFEVAGIPILAGTGLDEGGGPGDPPATVINRTLARRLFGQESPVGRRLMRFGTELTVVGVAEDVREYSPVREAPPALYTSLDQSGVTVPHLVLRTELGAPAAERRIREVLGELDPLLPVARVRPLADVVAASTGDRRAATVLMGFLGLLAFVLGAVGVYGVTSHAVEGRVREIGLRLALGATGAGVLGRTLWRSVALVLPGLALGVGGAFAARRFIESLLFEVDPLDPWVLLLVVLAFLGVAVVAGAAPARRAARVQPVEALREL